MSLRECKCHSTYSAKRKCGIVPLYIMQGVTKFTCTLCSVMRHYNIHMLKLAVETDTVLLLVLGPIFACSYIPNCFFLLSYIRAAPSLPPRQEVTICSRVCCSVSARAKGIFARVEWGGSTGAGATHVLHTALLLGGLQEPHPLASPASI